jgi:hypothetical protein
MMLGYDASFRLPAIEIVGDFTSSHAMGWPCSCEFEGSGGEGCETYKKQKTTAWWSFVL